MGSKGQTQAMVGDLDPGLSQCFHLCYQGSGIDHHSIAYQADGMWMNDSGRDQVQFEGSLSHRDCVSRVVSPIIASDEVGLGSQKIYDAAFTFISPLRPDDNI
jgi:hypothetical protein